MDLVQKIREAAAVRSEADSASSANTRAARLTPLTVRSEAGFTLVELMIVMAIIGVLSMIAVPSYISAIKHAREAVLKEDLRTLRSAIDSYTMDKQKAPQSLDDLIQDGYLKVIPKDPMTDSTTTWQTDQSDDMHSLDQTDPGIDDVHSGSQDTGSDGQAYNTW